MKKIVYDKVDGTSVRIENVQVQGKRNVPIPANKKSS